MFPFPAPFPQRTDYREGESLPSLLARLVDLNFYESINTPQLLVTDYLKTQQIRDNPLLPRHALTFALLEALTEIDQFTHHQATVHRFAPMLYRPTDTVPTMWIDADRLEVPIMDEVLVNKQTRATNVAAFCPCCLDDSGIHRTAWMLPVVTVCLKHRTLLHSRCPVCRQPPTVHHVVHNLCACGFPLSQTPLLPTPNAKQLDAHRAIHLWLGIHDQNTDFKLPKVSPRILLDVLHGLRLCIEHSKGKITRDELEIPERDISLFEIVDGREPRNVEWLFYTYALAFQIMTDWPYNFRAFLDKLSHDTTQGLHGLGTIYTQWIAKRWLYPEYQFLQDEFERFLIDAMIPSVAKIPRYSTNSDFFHRQKFILPAHAMMLLRISVSTLRRLVEQLKLTPIAPDQSKWRSPVMFRLDEVLALKETWEKSMSVLQASKLLGISEKAVIEAITLKILVAVRGPDSDGSSEWRLDTASIEQWLRQIMKAADDAPTTGRMLTLTSATQRCVALNQSLPHLLQAIVRGSLRAYCHPPLKGVGIQALRIRQSDLEHFKKKVLQERGWLGRKDIARLMGVKETVVAKWVRAGLLSPVNLRAGSRTLYFGGDEVHRFTTRYIFSDVAAALLKINVLTIQKWARGGRLHPVAGPGIDECHRYLFRREEIERLRPENRLTAPEAARLLGIDPSHILNLVRQGKVKAVSGPGIDHMGQYLFLRSDIS